MASLQDVSSYISNQIPGIDWSALDAKGRGGVWNRDYILEYMIPAYQRANTIRQTLNLTFDFTNKGAQQAFGDAAVSVKAASDIAVKAMKAGANVLAPEFALKLNVETYRYVIATLWHTALYGISLHNDETIQHSGLSDAEIQTHANLVTAMFNALYLMSQIPGALAPLRNDSETPPTTAPTADSVAVDITAPTATPPAAGIGALPIVAVVVIAIVVVAAIALIAWMLLSIADVSEKNYAVANICKEAQKRGDTATLQTCVTALSKPPLPPFKLPDSVMPYLFGGIALYLLIAFAPAITRSLVAARREAQA